MNRLRIAEAQSQREQGMAKTDFNPQTDGFSNSWRFEGVEIDALGSAVAAGMRATRSALQHERTR
jgi:hypothetical protein